MSQNAKSPTGKNKKKKDPANKRKIVGAVIAIIIVFTMLISVIEAIFQSNSITPSPKVSLINNTQAKDVCNI
jgi:hypothetical protein